MKLLIGHISEFLWSWQKHRCFTKFLFQMTIITHSVYLSIKCQRANNLWYNKGFINTAWRIFGSFLCILRTLPKEIYLFGLDLVVLLKLELVSYYFELKTFLYCSYLLHILNKRSLFFLIDNGPSITKYFHKLSSLILSMSFVVALLFRILLELKSPVSFIFFFFLTFIFDLVMFPASRSSS